MKLFNKIDKVLAAFGNIKAMERTHVDTYTETLITKIKGAKVGESKNGQIFFEFQNLNNYQFLNVSILSRNNIKTIKGASLLFIEANNEVYSISSDTKEIESNFSNISNRWLTKVSFVLTKKEKNMILEKKFTEIHFNHKKKSLILYKV